MGGRRACRGNRSAPSRRRTRREKDRDSRVPSRTRRASGVSCRPPVRVESIMLLQLAAGGLLTNRPSWLGMRMLDLRVEHVLCRCRVQGRKGIVAQARARVQGEQVFRGPFEYAKRSTGGKTGVSPRSRDSSDLRKSSSADCCWTNRAVVPAQRRIITGICRAAVLACRAEETSDQDQDGSVLVHLPLIFGRIPRAPCAPSARRRCPGPRAEPPTRAARPPR